MKLPSQCSTSGIVSFQRSLKIVSALFVAFGLTHMALATPLGPTYPAPGGNTFSAGTYTLTDTSAYSALYWGASTDFMPTASLDGTPDPLTTVSLSGNTVTYSGVTTWTNALTSAVQSAQVEAQVTFTGGSASWVTAASVLLPTSLGYVLDITGSSFSRSVAFYGNTGSGWQSLDSIEQISGHTGDTTSSFTGAFYYEPPVAAGVPDSAGTLGLMTLSLAGLVALRRKFGRI
jgi:hypothetical protein